MNEVADVTVSLNLFYSGRKYTKLLGAAYSATLPSPNVGRRRVEEV